MLVVKKNHYKFRNQLKINTQELDSKFPNQAKLMSSGRC